MVSSTKLAPDTTVLASEQTINEALATLLPVCSVAESVASPGVDFSSAVTPDLSEIVPGNFVVSVEPHGGEAGASPLEKKVMMRRKTYQAVIGFLAICQCSLLSFHVLLFSFFWVFSFTIFRVFGAHDSCFIGSEVFLFWKMRVKIVTPSPKPKRRTQFPELDVGLNGWSGTEDVSFPATPLSPDVAQLGRQLAKTMEERTARQIRSGLLIGVFGLCVLVCGTLWWRLLSVNPFSFFLLSSLLCVFLGFSELVEKVENRLDRPKKEGV